MTIVRSAAGLVALGLAVAFGPAHAQPTNADATVYLFSTFKEPEQDGLRFAFSFDGYHWSNMPGLFLKARAGRGIMRDPSICRAPDGTWHLVWTTAWRGDQGFGYAQSKDLVHWSEQQFVPVMAHEPTTVNVWAPELFYDERERQFIVCWASTIPGRFPDHLETPTNNHRMYFTTTRDFRTFAPTRLFLDPGFSVIDCCILKDADRYVLLLKDNTRPQRNLRVAFGDSPLGPWRDITPPFTAKLTEGPTALKIGDDWLIYYDAYGTKTYGAVRTRDFKTFTDVTGQMTFPPGLKHGTAFAATKKELDNLFKAATQQVANVQPPRVSPAPQSRLERCSAATVPGVGSDSPVGLPRLKVSQNRRFLVTSDGKPFFWLGDTAWELFHRLNRAEAEVYLRDRAAKGFTVIQAVALAELDGLTVPNPQGHLPLVAGQFLRPAVVDGPDNDYWDDIEWTLRLAERNGLYIGLLPMWGKYLPADTGNAERYGRFIGERFKDHGNIIWILGGDRPAPTKPEQDAWRAMAKGIALGVSGREDYDQVLMTYHTFGPDSASKYFHTDEWLDFTAIQSSHGDGVLNWKMIEQDYQRLPVKPVIDLETTYPDLVILKGMKPANDDHARRSAYWAVFSGAFGHTYGHNSIWQMYAPGRKAVLNAKIHWSQALHAPSATQMGYLRRLIESRPFLTQAPDPSLLADGGGDDLERVAALRGDGYTLIYTPNGKPFRVRLDKLSGKQVNASWFDPRTGEYRVLDSFNAQGERDFTPPGAPAVGNDWVLVLELR